MVVRGPAPWPIAFAPMTAKPRDASTADAHPLDDWREALGRKHAERSDVDTALEHAYAAYGLFGHGERAAVLTIGAAWRDADRAPTCVSHAGRHNEGIGRVLFERIVRMEAQFPGRRVPDDWVNPNRRVTGAVQFQQEHAVSGHACGIDFAVEGHRDPRLHVEPIELVQHRPILAL
jgi:hypothetical protein